MMYFEKGRITNRRKIKKNDKNFKFEGIGSHECSQVPDTPHGSVTAVCKVSPSCYRRSLWEDSLLDVAQRKWAGAENWNLSWPWNQCPSSKASRIAGNWGVILKRICNWKQGSVSNCLWMAKSWISWCLMCVCTT